MDDLAKAKAKMERMNQKVKKAQSISKRHTQVQPEGEQKKEDPKIDYIFELTEQLVELGLKDTEIAEYLEKVDSLSTKGVIELDNRETKQKAKLKQINRQIKRLLNPESTPSVKSVKSVQSEEMEEKIPVIPEKRYSTPKRPNISKVIRKKECPQVKTTTSGAAFLEDLRNEVQ